MGDLRSPLLIAALALLLSDSVSRAEERPPLVSYARRRYHLRRHSPATAENPSARALAGGRASGADRRSRQVNDHFRPQCPSRLRSSILRGAPFARWRVRRGNLLNRRRVWSLSVGLKSIIAGLHCTDWTWTEDVETHTVCATADGVLLRLVVDGATIMQARSVSYGPQAAELFQVPIQLFAGAGA